MDPRIAQEIAQAKGLQWNETLGILADLARTAPALALALAKLLQAFPDHTEADKLGKLLEAFVSTLPKTAT